jgi:exosortase B
VDFPALAMVLLGFAVLYLPVYWELLNTLWRSDEQGHGPIILAVSAWLLYASRQALADAPGNPMPRIGFGVLVLALAIYAVGLSQNSVALPVLSQVPLIAALVLIFLGPRALRLVWFPLFFLLFMTPFPEALVAEITGPLKSAVSVVAANLLFAIGYPVSRVGVILNVGQYQLLVADACAGLHSMFTLEALGLLYLNLMNYTSVARNALISIMVVPIAFVANVTRVMILVLVTYYFGDAAGQGFVHSFAGMVLFLVGLALVLTADQLLGLVLIKKIPKIEAAA